MEASHYTDEDYTNVNCLQKQLSEVQAVVRAEQKIFRLDTQRLTHDNYMLIPILQSEYIKKPHVSSIYNVKRNHMDDYMKARKTD